MIEILEETIKKEMEKDPLERWEKLGFLYGIDNKRIKLMTAEWFERVAQYLLNNEEKVKELTKDKVLKQEDLEMLAFPIIRRSVQTLEYIQEVRDNPEKFINEIVEYWENNKDFLDCGTDLTPIHNIDKEAEMCNGFVGKHRGFNHLIKLIKGEEIA